MKRTLMLMAVGLGSVGIPASAAEPLEFGTVSIELPEATAQLQPGAGSDTAKAYCMICHSVDYVYMQPPLSEDKWQAEVVKMQKVYGCPLPEKDVETLVNYLLTQNGAPQPSR